jgi:hypothetical protein
MRAFSMVLLLALIGSQAGAQCKMPMPRLVCAEYFHSKAVVIAKLAGTTPARDSNDDVIGTYYSMTVEQTFRGKAPRLFRVYASNESGPASFEWKTGDTYLLFLLEETSNGAWMIDACGNSGSVERSRAALEHIEAIDPGSNRAKIFGSVVGPSIPYPVTGVQIQVRGPGGTNTIDTEKDGSFELRVAPGKYQLRALSPGKTFVASEFTYEDPDSLLLENAGCAQVQFIEAPDRH